MVALLGNCFGASLFDMSKTKLTKEVVNERLFSRGLLLIGEYSYRRKASLFRCKNGHEWMTTPNILLMGHGCPRCSNVCPIQSKERFWAEVERRGFVKNGEYVKSGQKVSLFCSIGHEFEITPSDLKGGYGCSLCSSTNPDKSKTNFLTLAVNEGYAVLGEYTKNSKKVDMKCPVGHHFRMSPNEFKSGNRCSYCSKCGFKRLEPAVLYVYNLERNGLNGIGFGVSNNFRIRHKAHMVSFGKTNTKWKLLAKIQFKTGEQALEIETKLKRHPDIFDFGVTGFRAECLPNKLKRYVLETITTIPLFV